MALTKDLRGEERVLRKKTPKPMQNTNPRSLPGNPNEGEQNRKMKENYEKQNRWANNNPYYPKKAPTAKFNGKSNVKYDGKDKINTAKDRLYEAFGVTSINGTGSKNKAGGGKQKISGGGSMTVPAISGQKVKKSGGTKTSFSSPAISGVNFNGNGKSKFTMIAQKASKSKKSKKKR